MAYRSDLVSSTGQDRDCLFRLAGVVSVSVSVDVRMWECAVEVSNKGTNRGLQETMRTGRWDDGGVSLSYFETVEEEKRFQMTSEN